MRTHSLLFFDSYICSTSLTKKDDTKSSMAMFTLFDGFCLILVPGWNFIFKNQYLRIFLTTKFYPYMYIKKKQKKRKIIFKKPKYDEKIFNIKRRLWDKWIFLEYITTYVTRSLVHLYNVSLLHGSLNISKSSMLDF